MIDPTLLLSMLILVAYVGLCYLLGRVAIDTLVRPAPPLLIAGGALLGATLLALQLWLYGAVQIPWNVWTLLLPWVAISALRRDRLLALVREERQRVARLGRALRTLNGLELVLVAAGTLIILTYMLNLVAKPLFATDAISAWLFKAKLYYSQQAVDLQAVSGDSVPAWNGSSVTFTRALDYPPLFSLMAASLYTLLGQANDLLGKAVSFIFVPVAAAASLAALTRWLNRQLAITFTFLLVALPLFALALLTGPQMGFADYPLAVCMMLSLVYFYDGERSARSVSYLFAVVFAAMAALIKNEGLPFLLIILALLLIHLVTWGRLRRPARRDWPILAVLLLAIAPVVAWRAYVQIAGLTVGSAVGQINVANQVPLLSSRLSFIYQYLGSIPSSPSVWTVEGWLPASYADLPWLAIGFLLSGVLLAANRFRSGTFVFVAIGLQALTYLVFYLFTPVDLYYILASTADRLVLQLAPSIVLMLAIALRPLLDRPKVEPIRPLHETW